VLSLLLKEIELGLSQCKGLTCVGAVIPKDKDLDHCIDSGFIFSSVFTGRYIELVIM
jgi:hypothetical protein